MKLKQTLMFPLMAGALSLTAMGAHAAVTPEQLNSVLDKANEYGFTHYKEISADDGEVEIEGWVGNEWAAEVDFSEDGNVLREERKRRGGNASGLSADDVRAAIDAAKAEGVARIDEIETRRGGFIDVEGLDESGRDIEVRLNGDTFKVVNVDRD